MSFTITQIDSDNCAVLSHYEPDVFDEAVDPRRLQRVASDPSHLFLVALSDGKVVGQILAMVHHHPDKVTELYIDELGVAPQYQRQGIARALLNRLITIGQKRQCRIVWLATEPDNQQALAFYQAMALKRSPALVFDADLPVKAPFAGAE